MRFVETPIFTAAITRLLSDDAYARLQVALALRPAQGTIVRGSGGLRKLRWAATGRGKRAGIRVIYFWDPAADLCYMLAAYPKAKRETLTHAQLKTLSRLVREKLQ